MTHKLVVNRNYFSVLKSQKDLLTYKYEEKTCHIFFYCEKMDILLYNMYIMCYMVSGLEVWLRGKYPLLVY